MKTRRIKPGEKVPVAFTERERELVIDQTFAGGELTEELEAARPRGGRCVIRCTLDDLDELLGYVAAEANHSKNKKLQKELDALHNRLQEEMQTYDDGQWQASSVTLGLAQRESAESRRAALAIVKARKVL